MNMGRVHHNVTLLVGCKNVSTYLCAFTIVTFAYKYICNSDSLL